MKKFKFLEHTADVYVETYGTSLEEAFENAALATLSVMTDIEKVEPIIEEDFEVKAIDQFGLLYNWIEEILVNFDLTGRLYSRIMVSKIETINGYLKLKAKGWGESYDPVKHKSRVGIKSITYHRMQILKTPKSIILKFILDV